MAFNPEVRKWTHLHKITKNLTPLNGVSIRMNNFDIPLNIVEWKKDLKIEPNSEVIIFNKNDFLLFLANKGISLA